MAAQKQELTFTQTCAVFIFLARLKAITFSAAIGDSAHQTSTYAYASHRVTHLPRRFFNFFLQLTSTLLPVPNLDICWESGPEHLSTKMRPSERANVCVQASEQAYSHVHSFNCVRLHEHIIVNMTSARPH